MILTNKVPAPKRIEANFILNGRGAVLKILPTSVLPKATINHYAANSAPTMIRKSKLLKNLSKTL